MNKPRRITVVEGRPVRIGDLLVTVRRKPGRQRGRRVVVVIEPADLAKRRSTE